jgi:hypothetical protein
MDNEYDRNEFFSRSIAAAFRVAGFQSEDLSYEPPKAKHGQEMPGFLRDQLNGTRRKDPWGQGWHNGFPPPSGA